MLSHRPILPLLLVFAATFLWSDMLAQERKSIPAIRATGKIEIDGVLNDADWQRASVAKDFVMFEPDNGKPEPQRLKSEVRVLYTDEAIYIGAMLYDHAPDSILTQVTQRDNHNENCDWFGFFINPYNDGLSDFNFWVTAAGTQSDSRTTETMDDFSLNSVWKSDVSITDSGWIVEAEIPYIALRFPETPVKDWGLNFMRNVRRSRYTYSWNFLDLASGNRLEYQCGLLTNVSGIDPPVRLSLMPYVSGYIDDFNGTTTYNANAGLDLKYGLNESFTLDMTLIPDFGQVAYDQQFLNLSPFENRFDENRQFFTEGTELFTIADLLYTRRIGGTPKNIQGVSLMGNDSVEIRQEYTKLINATKISGRTKGNLGIGVLNAVTADNYTTVVSNGETTELLTEPLTNYNIIVLDQRFNRNSSVSLVNTNVLRKGGARDANVTALKTSIYTPSGNHRLDVTGKQSMIFETASPRLGYNAVARFADVGGNWVWAVEENLMTEQFDINDMGFLPRNNYHYHLAEFGYKTVRPVGPFNKFKHDVWGYYQTLFDPYTYEEVEFGYDAFFLLRSFFAFGYNVNARPIGSIDYFEPRTAGRYFERPQRLYVGGFISSDYRKTLALDMNFGHSWWAELGRRQRHIQAKPRIRLGDHFFSVLGMYVGQTQSDYGYVPDSDPLAVYFGRRNNLVVTNTIDAQYVFTPRSSLSMMLRHTYTDVDYQAFYLLEEDGSLTPSDLDGVADLNFNAFNIDVRYSWWFAPGSELVILYRNSVAAVDDEVGKAYLQNLDDTFDAPVQNNISVRFTYFLDYNKVRNRITDRTQR